MNDKERICPYCGSNEIESDNIAYFFDNALVIECYCRSCNEFFDEIHNINSSEIVEGAFQWCLVELDAKVQAEHSKKWANRLQKVKENCAIVKSLGYEALRQWEELIMPSFVEDFKKDKYLNSMIYGEALHYTIDMMRDFIENTKFNKELVDCDGEFIYNNTPLQY